MSKLIDSLAWRNLQTHYDVMQHVTLTQLFENEPERFHRFSYAFQDFLFDFSKNHITDETLSLLMQLARDARLSERIQDLFSGKKINTSEDRPVMHMALRNPNQNVLLIDNKNIMEDIHRELAKMKIFVENVLNRKLLGFSGLPITDIVNVGV